MNKTWFFSSLLIISCGRAPTPIALHGNPAAGPRESGNVTSDKPLPIPVVPAVTPTPAPAQQNPVVTTPMPIGTPIPSPVPAPLPIPTPVPVPMKPAYNPCPAAGTTCLIMPFGDSITAGVGSSRKGGYRLPLLHLINTAKQNVSFVGPNKFGPDTLDGKAFVKDNAGYSGYTIEKSVRSGISEMAVDLINTYKPHIVTLMIGTNDLGINEDLDNAPLRLGKLVDKIFATSPNTLVVLAQIVPSKDDNFNLKVKTYNEGVLKLVMEKVAAGKHIITVDMFTAMTRNADYKTTLFNDGLHPNDAGYVVMAGVWYTGLLKFFH